MGGASCPLCCSALAASWPMVAVLEPFRRVALACWPPGTQQARTQPHEGLRLRGVRCPLTYAGAGDQGARQRRRPAGQQSSVQRSGSGGGSVITTRGRPDAQLDSREESGSSKRRGHELRRACQQTCKAPAHAPRHALPGPCAAAPALTVGWVAFVPHKQGKRKGGDCPPRVQ